jgi:hypothetical protein
MNRLENFWIFVKRRPPDTDVNVSPIHMSATTWTSSPSGTTAARSQVGVVHE